MSGAPPFVYRHKVLAGSGLLVLIGAPYGFCLTAPLIREVIKHPTFGVIYFTTFILLFAWGNLIGGGLSLLSLCTRNATLIHRAKVFALLWGFLSLASLVLLTMGWLGLFSANGWWAMLFAIPLCINYSITWAGLRLLARSTRVKSSHEEDFDTMLSVLKPASEKMLKSSSFTCTICLNDLMVNPLVTPCGHAFCRDCIYSWLMNKKKTCPLCRKDLLECAKQQKLLPATELGDVELDDVDLEKQQQQNSPNPNSPSDNAITNPDTDAASPRNRNDETADQNADAERPSRPDSSNSSSELIQSTSAISTTSRNDDPPLRLMKHLSDAFTTALKLGEHDEDEEIGLQINRRAVQNNTDVNNNANVIANDPDQSSSTSSASSSASSENDLRSSERNPRDEEKKPLISS